MKERKGEPTPLPDSQTGALSLSQGGSRPAEVWSALSQAEQAQIYHQMVIICRSLVQEVAPTGRAEEVGHDPV